MHIHLQSNGTPKWRCCGQEAAVDTKTADKPAVPKAPVPSTADKWGSMLRTDHALQE